MPERPHIPRQRKGNDSTGGRGGHSKNRELSGRRGGSPGAPKPPKKGSGGAKKTTVVLLFMMFSAPLLGLAYVAAVVLGVVDA